MHGYLSGKQHEFPKRSYLGHNFQVGQLALNNKRQSNHTTQSTARFTVCKLPRREKERKGQRWPDVRRHCLHSLFPGSPYLVAHRMGASQDHYILGPGPIYRLALTWPPLTQNIKDYQMGKERKTIQPWQIRKGTFWMDSRMKGWTSEALHLSGSAAPLGLLYKAAGHKHGPLLWDEKRR